MEWYVPTLHGYCGYCGGKYAESKSYGDLQAAFDAHLETTCPGLKEQVDGEAALLVKGRGRL